MLRCKEFKGKCIVDILIDGELNLNMYRVLLSLPQAPQTFLKRIHLTERRWPEKKLYRNGIVLSTCSLTSLWPVGIIRITRVFYAIHEQYQLLGVLYCKLIYLLSLSTGEFNTNRTLFTDCESQCILRTCKALGAQSYHELFMRV